MALGGCEIASRGVSSALDDSGPYCSEEMGAMRTLTVLYTDLVGSSGAWESSASAAEGLLAVHDSTGLATVAAHGGIVFKHVGDGLIARFEAATEAVLAAIELQQKLAGTVADKLVRVAVHSGTVTEKDGDLFGPAMNRGARLVAAAHGGQVICSQATAELVRDDLPADAALSDLGNFRLHGLARPEHVWQVVAPGLDPVFPPLRTLGLPRHNLPLAPTSFVGRELELADICDLLREARLVTITGPGGTGKTRLAIEVASVQAPEYPDGVFFVDLSVIDEDDEVTLAAAKAIGVSGAEPPADAVIRSLSERRTLLVVDNCEHVLEGCADLVDALLRTCPDVDVVATSREPLGTVGEHAHVLGPLGCDHRDAPAIRLFEARATAAHPGFAVESADAVVVELCRRLDGLPLAIELAAAHVRHSTLSEIFDRLDDRFRMLTGGRRIARHQTLRATIEWSHARLSDQERALLRRLSVFAGEFSRADALALANDGELSPSDADVALDRLVSKSMVLANVSATTARYRLLESVREFAAEQLANSRETAAVRLRLADALIAWGEANVLHPFALQSWRLVQSRWPDVRASLDWLVEDGDVERAGRLLALVEFVYVYPLGPEMLEVRRWLPRVLDGVDRLDVDTRVAVLALAFSDAVYRLAPEMIDLARRATAVEGASVTAGLIAAWSGRATAELTGSPSRDYVEALADEALRVGEAAPTRALAAHLWCGVALALLPLGRRRIKDAIALAERAVGVFASETEFYPDSAFIAGHTLVAGYHLEGRDDEAARVAVRILETVDEHFGDVDSWSPGIEAGVIAAAGQRALALSAIQRSVARHRRLFLPALVTDDLIALAMFATTRGDFETAALLLGSVPMTSAFRSPASARVAWHYHGLVRQALGDRYDELTRKGAAMGVDACVAMGVATEEREVADPVFEAGASVWRVSFAGHEVSLKASKGLGDIARLVARPGEPIAAVELAGEVVVLASKVDAIDATAKKAYQARLAELDDAIAIAERRGNLDRAAALDTERAVLVDHLAASVGLRGRARTLDDQSERARKTISARIRDAMAHIEHVDAELGAHLRTHIRLGTACVYRPTDGS